MHHILNTEFVGHTDGREELIDITVFENEMAKTSMIMRAAKMMLKVFKTNCKVHCNQIVR